MMFGLTRVTVFSCSVVLALSSLSTNADNRHFEFDAIGLLLNLAGESMLHDNSMQLAKFDRRPRRDRSYRQRSNSHVGSNNRRGFSHAGNAGRSIHSYTSPPLRGGSSRRTRIIENPYSNRVVTGITLTGIDNNIVHIKDVIAYPRRQLISPFSYSLSAYEPSRFINTRGRIDYISLQAKRKEYFTVTFHYD